MSKKLKVDGLKKGEFLSRTSHMKVNFVHDGFDYVNVTNEDGLTWDIGAEIVESECNSSSQYTTEIKVSRTEIVQKLAEVGDAVFTVNYNKQIEASDVVKTIEGLYANGGGKLLSKSEFMRKVKASMRSITKGEERTLVGRLIHTPPKFGRFLVVDLEIERDGGEHDNRLRLVDQQTINWLITKGVKYIVK